MTEEAIPAATLILVREPGSGPPELLMVERAEGMAFAGGAMVFPGGRIDRQDREFAGNDRAAAVAAVRETIEETAIPAALTPLPSPGEAARMQQALAGGEDFSAILQSLGAALDFAALTPLARWVPKFHARRRFDTLFLIGRAPEGEWMPRVIEGECTAAEWVSAADLLKRDQAGEARMIFPTRRTLERLALHSSFDAMVADALAHPIAPITPWVEEIDGERYVTIPGDIGFPVVRERLDGLWRG